ncbi:bifunctional diaminohydroxyphosphoribosylaminopyrimidine deaminase/5-amino-6-(5-phosphoribosylamino)uracil reductase RibD [Pseudovibrio sp. Tun.PSC04-5.I4]|uniref:bifunctional diaminohydroxyphosphoribosylaminopyrimidine deaminase/5-amino-6-(5-phosphoribosylamino)uracil reductase RibD n=1 Tax=Pseudovibrio sp. Tun.PSC04-5.I4 TaxID=1798213 RepID=UPI00087EB6FE|nr:bifunctional diaminohydroxyphosphoribosylaminopyrimidine deaminase/5-amino-6-(5-phosphoribosylamino)uracil reductase RibD [Pseudovibrio sp. Tun.PSC04-5.I4]SDR12953.1 diaminohydroxyphosphoribosylaminopyrimidine deaminase / 5-amino-6-(5-phosphoribosylamino)uracil reductase [Pseudovibrio sp. Tun.PSC04-5.I4]
MSGHKALNADELAEHERFMAAAISYGIRAKGQTWPNPPVGALLTKDFGNGPVVVGQGATLPPGGSHAEVLAIIDAGEHAKGATAYVTLEPCAHYGRTGPCARALVAAGVSRVIYGAADPNPAVAGRGKRMLEEGGVEVIVGVLEKECQQAVRGHICRVLKDRPFVQLKMAVSKDGYIGKRGAGQVSISGALSRQLVHAMRSQMDAIVVGIGTVLEDDPELSCRLPGLEGRSPQPVVFDSLARMPLKSNLVQSAGHNSLWVVVGEHAPDHRVSALEREGVTVIINDCLRNGKVCLDKALEALYMHGLSQIMVEGGAELAHGLLQQDLVDELMIFQGTTDIGSDGIQPFGFEGLASLQDGYNKQMLRYVGEDLLWRYTPKERF